MGNSEEQILKAIIAENFCAQQKNVSKKKNHQITLNGEQNYLKKKKKRQNLLTNKHRKLEISSWK